MFDMALAAAKSQAIVLLAQRSSHVRKVALAAEAAKDAGALAEAQDEIDRIDSAIGSIDPRPPANLDLELLHREAVAQFETAISQLEHQEGNENHGY